MSSRAGRPSGDGGATFLSRLVVLLFIVVIIYPILSVIMTSLKSTSEFFLNIWWLPRSPNFSNFSYAWSAAHIGSYLINSLFVVVLTVFFITFLGLMAGYALARLDVPGANAILLLLLVSTMLPSESVIMPMYIIVSRLHFSGTFASLIIPYIGWGLPITIIIFRTFFKSLPVEMIEAARIDGCNEAQAFFRIVAPPALPPTATTAIFNFVFFWGELLWATITLASTSGLRTIPLGILAFKSQFATDWGPLSAAIVIILVPLLIFFLFVQKYFVRGLTAGAVKG
jgi:raffinose/stachyose/melibiose transport system permease protein